MLSHKLIFWRGVVLYRPFYVRADVHRNGAEIMSKRPLIDLEETDSEVDSPPLRLLRDADYSSDPAETFVLPVPSVLPDDCLWLEIDCPSQSRSGQNVHQVRLFCTHKIDLPYQSIRVSEAVNEPVSNVFVCAHSDGMFGGDVSRGLCLGCAMEYAQMAMMEWQSSVPSGAYVDISLYHVLGWYMSDAVVHRWNGGLPLVSNDYMAAGSVHRYWHVHRCRELNRHRQSYGRVLPSWMMTQRRG